MTSTNLLVLDIDKTLKPVGRPIPELIKNELHRLKQDGHIIVLATGRSMYDTGFIEDSLGNTNHYGVYLNGSITSKNDASSPQIINKETFNGINLYSQIKNNLPHHYAVSDVFGFPAKFSGYIQSHVASFFKDAKGYHIVDSIEKVITENLTKLSLIAHAPEKANEIGSIMESSFGHLLSSHVYDSRIVEIGPAGVTKASGVEHVLKNHDAPLNNIIIVGDNHNDVPLFEWGNKIGADTYAMANAVTPLKKIAKYETGDVNKEGMLNLLKSL
jgi:5-amino-6-(5-phospho-D-ribitylamino)uracil phosphatase